MHNNKNANAKGILSLIIYHTDDFCNISLNYLACMMRALVFLVEM